MLKVKQAIRLIYEKLTVLEYLEGQLEGGSQSYDSKSFREQNWFVEPEPVPQPEHKEELVEPLMEKIKDIVAQMPEESRQVDELLEAARVATDQAERARLYQEMQVIVQEDAPWVFVANWKQNAVTSDRVENFTLQPSFFLRLDDVTKN